MSEFLLSFKLRGQLPDDNKVTEIIGKTATKFFRKGDLLNLKIPKIQHEDLWILNLTPNLDDDRDTANEIEAHFIAGAKILEEIAPSINQISSDEFTAELYVSIFIEESQGGFTLPPQLIHAASYAGLPIRMSIIA
jgi:hypothetical protein